MPSTPSPTTDRPERSVPPRVRASRGPRRGPARVGTPGWRRHLGRGATPATPATSASSRPPAGRRGTATRAARATRGALGVSTARRAAVLAVVVCALALTVAVPLRNYVTQRHEIAAVSAERARLADEVASLAAQRGALADPAHVQALARERLGYARPGETPYRVQLPGAAEQAPAAGAGSSSAPVEADLPWYARLGRETLGARDAPDPSTDPSTATP